VRVLYAHVRVCLGVARLEGRVQGVMEHLGQTARAIPSRLKAEQLRVRPVSAHTPRLHRY
jgi:hypothetical protein